MKRPLFSAGALSFAALLFCACLSLKTIFWLILSVVAVALIVCIFAKVRKWRFSVFICLIIVCIAISRFYIFNLTGPKNSEKLIARTAFVTATVTQEPEYEDGYYVYKIKTDSISFPNVSQKMKLKILLNQKLFQIGDIVEGNFKFYEIDEEYKNTNYAEGIYIRSHPVSISKTGTRPQNFNSFASNIRVKVRNVITRSFPKEVSGILIGLITNGTKHLDDETYAAFKICGLTHTVSVSGMHMALLSNAVLLFVGMLGVAKRTRFLFCLPLLLIYTAVSGFSPASIRSVIMISAAFFGDVFYRRADSLTALGATGIAMLLVSPNLIYSLSFWLSFTSMTGILAATPYCIKLSNMVQIKGLVGDFLRYVITLSLTTVSANFATLPLVVLVWGWFSTVSVIANILISFAISICLIFGLILLSLILLFGENGFFGLLFKPLEYMLWYVRNTSVAVSKIPFNYISVDISTLLGIYCAICVIAAIVFIVKKLPKQKIATAIQFAAVFMITSILLNRIF